MGDFKYFKQNFIAYLFKKTTALQKATFGSFVRKEITTHFTNNKKLLRNFTTMCV